MTEQRGNTILAKIGENSFFTTVATILAATASLATSILLARYLGAEDYGAYSYTLWIIGIAAIFANCGLPNTVIKFIAEYHVRSAAAARKFYLSIVRTEAVLAIGCSVAIALYGVFNGNARLMTIAALLIIPQSVGRILSSVAHGLQAYAITTRARLFITPLQVAVLWTILASGKGVAAVLLLLTAAETVNCLIISRAIGAKLPRSSDEEPGGRIAWGRVIKFSSSIFFLAILDAVVWQRVEVFFLKQFSTLASVGIYSLGFGLIYMMMQIPVNMTNVLFPVFSEAYGAEAHDVLRRGYYFSIKYLAVLLLPPVTLFFIVAPQVITLLYGVQYIGATTPLRILLIVSTIATFHRPISTALYSTENQRFIIQSNLFLALVNIALDIILIPGYDMTGAAVASAVVQITSVALGLMFIHRKFRYNYPLDAVIRTALCCLLSAIPFALLSARLTGIPLLGVCGAGFPLLLLGLMRIVRPLREETDRRIFENLTTKIPRRYRAVFSVLLHCCGAGAPAAQGNRR